MKKVILISAIAAVIAACSVDDGRSAADYPEWEYTKIKKELVRGWNTWDTRSVFTQVWSEDKLGVRMSFVDSEGAEFDQIRIGNRDDDAAVVHPYDHTYDGRYSEVDASWHGISVKLRSASEGRRLVMLLTPVEEGNTGSIKVRAGQNWEAMPPYYGGKKVFEDHFELVCMFGTEVMVGKVVAKDKRFVQAGSEDGYYLCASDAPVLVYTGEDITVEEAEALMSSRKEEFEKEGRAKWGDNYETYHAMQSILAWDTIYDPMDGIVVTPVSRNWNMSNSYVSDIMGAYVLFDWDTYFASEMLSVDNRELAYCNAIEITMAADKCGFVPNFTTSNSCSTDRSQPPVGSRAVWTIYERYHDRWFLEMLYPRLLRWNMWWPENRDAGGLLCWGSTPGNGGRFSDERYARQQAIYESGLDNTWVYDESEFLFDKNMVNYNDVGLSSMYVMDCEYLARIADELGRRKEARQIRNRGKYYRDNLQALWSEEDGMFYCKDVRNGELVRKMDPTNFYPLLCNAATKEQADRMVREHLLNEEEFWGEWVIPCSPRNTQAFRDNNYWRGRIWGPTNFLVYLGLRNYGYPDVRKEFAGKSNALLMKDWLARGYIYENWNAVTGEGDDVGNSDRFYHWGSLLGYIKLLESN